MKNRIWTDALREVRHTLGRFLSLLLLSALAVSFLAGLRTTAPDMERSADNYYDAQRLMDVRVLSPLGLTAEDIAVLADQPGIAEAEGAFAIDAIAGGGESDFVVKALSIGPAINLPRLVEGRMPEGSGECLVEPKLFTQLGLALGDDLTLSAGAGPFETALAHTTFTVVGTADSPLYISSERGSSSLGSGRVAAFVLLPTSAFTMATYTDAYLLAGGAADLLCYSAVYERKIADLLDALKPLEDTRARSRYDEVVGEANAKLAEELPGAQRQPSAARREIDDITPYKWYVLGRNTNAGYVSFQGDAQRMGKLASVFPVIFFLVAALVCLTTMTRMVEEQRVQIGSLKALGYGKGAVSIKYVGYGLAASLLGGGLGLAFGCTVIPWIIYTAWSTLYTLGPLTIPFYPGISLLSVGAAVLTVAGSAALTCRSTLAEAPASLMRPKAPKSGKRVLLERIDPLWKRLSFTHKVTVRNLFRYKRRFWMTVVGIGGCTALIITGFGLRDSIFSIMAVQYEQIHRFTSQIGLVDGVTEGERAEIDQALVKNPDVTAYLPIHQATVSVEGANRAVDAMLFSPANGETFAAFVHLRHREGHTPVPLPEEGVVLTEKLAALLKIKPGDEVTLDGERRVTARVTGVTEHYIGHFVYLSAPAYLALYGEPPTENMLLAQYREDTRELADGVSSALISLSGVTSVSRIADTRQAYQQSLERVDYAVLVIIVSAAALAFVVLFNLTNINMTERMRELATLKVLGFHDRELSAYVFRENALLTVFGALAGLVMGKLLHQWLVLTVEIDMLMFGRTAKPMSYLFAVALTLLFSVVVNLVAGRKLKKIDMVESLKTVE